MGKYDTRRWAEVLGALTDILDVQAVQDYLDRRGIELVWPDDGVDPNALQGAMGKQAIVAGSNAFWREVFEPAMEELDRKVSEVITRCTGIEWRSCIREWGAVVEFALALTEVVGGDALDEFRKIVLEASESDDPFAVVAKGFCRLARSKRMEPHALLDIVIGYIIALAFGLAVLLLPRKEPLPEGASIGFLLIVFFVWMIFILAPPLLR